jgi:glyoxylase-like metal-dependent hydrolase (beta-lactamase superfamily II)
LRLGNADLHIVSDGLAWMDGGGHFGLVPKVLWEKVVQADELNRIPMALNCLLVVSEGKRILVDTGFGDKLSPKERQIWSIAGENRLVGNLRRLGFAPEDIEIVINTHLHSDHCGGNTVLNEGQVVPTFPRAEYWIQRLEWADARYPNERTRATYLAENFVPLEERGQLRLLYGDTRVTSEVRCIVTRGHTRAHQSVVIESGGETAIYLGDLASWAILMERLAWVSAFDAEPLETIETKRRVRDWALEKNALLIFEHDSRVQIGYLREDEGKYKVEAV